MVCKLQKFIYGLKKSSRSWKIYFDQAIKSFGFVQNNDEPCVYKKDKGGIMVILILYVDDNMLIGFDFGVLSTVKVWLASIFNMKDLSEACYILEIKLLRDRNNKMIGLSHASYIEEVLTKFSMDDAKKG